MQGLNYLHCKTPSIIHKDLKAENILLEKKCSGRGQYLHAAISDFGLASDDRKTSGSSGGTLRILPPETLLDAQAPRGKPADVYAFGLLCYEIITGKCAFFNMSSQMLRSTVLTGGRPEIPDSVPTGLRELIRRCWAQDADSRPTSEEILFALQAEIKQLSQAPGRDFTTTMNSLSSAW